MKRATYEDVLNAPEHKVAEILDGELFLSPMLAPRDCVVHSGLLGSLGSARGGWWILPKPEVHLGEDIVVPDIGGWRREDVPILPDAYFSVPPTWLCEVLAPTTERFDRARKLRIYAAAGVAHAWLVTPADRTLEVLRLRDGAWTIVAVRLRLRHGAHRALRRDRAGAGPPLGGSPASAVAGWSPRPRSRFEAGVAARRSVSSSRSGWRSSGRPSSSSRSAPTWWSSWWTRPRSRGPRPSSTGAPPSSPASCGCSAAGGGAPGTRSSPSSGSGWRWSSALMVLAGRYGAADSIAHFAAQDPRVDPASLAVSKAGRRLLLDHARPGRRAHPRPAVGARSRAAPGDAPPHVPPRPALRRRALLLRPGLGRRSRRSGRPTSRGWGP